MMRIGVVAPRQPPSIGGGFTFHTTVLKTLNNAVTKHEFVILDIAGLGIDEVPGNNLQYVDATTFNPESASTKPTARYVSEGLGLDVVWYLDPLAEALSVPVFATVLDLAHRQHPFFPEVSTTGWKWDLREGHYQQVLPRAARVFTGTQTGKEQVVRCYGVNPENIVVNPFPTSIFPKCHPTVTDDAILLKHELSPGFLFYPAQFWEHKNHKRLIQAVAKLKRNVSNLKLVLAGSKKNSYESTIKLAQDLNIAEDVIFLGYVPDNDMPEIYRHAHAMIMPTFFGPTNIPVLEAFAAGCPAAVSNIYGMPEQVGDAALLFDPKSVDDIADAMAKIHDNKDQLADV